MFVISEGSTLPNGATVLGVVRKHHNVRKVVCSWGERDYVTLQVDDDGNAYWGHYFPFDPTDDEDRKAALQDAYSDFNKR